MNLDFIFKRFENWFLKDSSGVPSGTFSFAVISFLVTIFAIVAPMLSDSINKPDSTLVLGTTGMAFLAYVNRRNKQEAAINVDDEVEK